MRPNPQETVHLVMFTEEIHNEKLHFFVQWRELSLYRFFSWIIVPCFILRSTPSWIGLMYLSKAFDCIPHNLIIAKIVLCLNPNDWCFLSYNRLVAMFQRNLANLIFEQSPQNQALQNAALNFLEKLKKYKSKTHSTDWQQITVVLGFQKILIWKWHPLISLLQNICKKVKFSSFCLGRIFKTYDMSFIN